MAIRNVYFRGETTPNQQVSSPQQIPQVVTNPIQKSKPDIISKDGANALRAYTLQSSINTTPKREDVGTSEQYIENFYETFQILNMKKYIGQKIFGKVHFLD